MSQLPHLPIVVMPEEAPGSRTVTLNGTCADFCAQDGPTRGAPIEQHGPLCLSAPCGREIEAITAAGDNVDITLELARSYLHGDYSPTHARSVSDDRLVRMTLWPTAAQDPTERDNAVFLTSGEARRLATALTEAARQGDQLDRDLNHAAMLRERQRFQAI